MGRNLVMVCITFKYKHSMDVYIYVSTKNLESRQMFAQQ